MHQASAVALTRHYDKLQRQWRVEDRSADYARLVVPNGNSDEPFHRWFHLKEAFSSRLVGQLLKEANKDQKEISLLDPFLGGGTSLVSAIVEAERLAVPATLLGVERNPFLHALSSAKIRGRLAGRTLVAPLHACFSEIESLVNRTDAPKVYWPPSSTLANENYFPPENVEILLRIAAAIEKTTTGLGGDVLRSCLAASVEPSSRLRRDGRALRFEPKRQPGKSWELFSERVRIVLSDLQDTNPFEGAVAIHHGDGRQLDGLVGNDVKYNNILFSPPYPNNIDYTEVYKVESWILGYYRTAQDMRSQRLSTVRSHPSVRFEDEYYFSARDDSAEIFGIMEPLLEAIPGEDRYTAGRRQLVQGYVDDMLRVLMRSRGLVSEDGNLTFVVGNSAHGPLGHRFVIAADLLMAELAQHAGWQVDEIRVARTLTRRTAESEFLRESVVILSPA